jgi:hypothetical protein
MSEAQDVIPLSLRSSFFKTQVQPVRHLLGLINQIHVGCARNLVIIGPNPLESIYGTILAFWMITKEKAAF